MSRVWLPLIVLLQFGPIQAEKLDSLANSLTPSLLETYRYLHAHPELSYFERETASYLSTQLREIGFEVSEGIGDYGVPGLTSYGFVAVMKNGSGPRVMVRTDLDALPVEEKTGLPFASKVRTTTTDGVETGVMHACGHDLHMTVFLGTARLLAQSRNLWKGTLVMIGQPAEERGAGAEAMIKDGLYARFGKPDYALALHAAPELPAGQVGYRAGFALAAVDSVDIRVKGQGGHGAYPQATKDPIVLASQIVLALQTIVSRTVSPFDPAVVTVGSIHGGAKHNIIPDSVDLQLTIRSYKPEVRRVILDSIRRIVEGQARAAGIPEELMPEVRISENEGIPVTMNDAGLVERVVRSFNAELGPDGVVEVPPVMGGEDFSRYRLEGDQVPTFIFWLGAVDPERFAKATAQGEKLPPLHSSQFCPRAELAVPTGVRAMASAVIGLMPAQ